MVGLLEIHRGVTGWYKGAVLFLGERRKGKFNLRCVMAARYINKFHRFLPNCTLCDLLRWKFHSNLEMKNTRAK